jgi:ABC-type Mn2+/Zn2+ transport system permease subunit
LQTNRLRRMMLIAIGIAVFSSLVGMLASYYFGVSSGSAIVLTCTACFGLAWLLRARRGGVLA